MPTATDPARLDLWLFGLGSTPDVLGSAAACCRPHEIERSRAFKSEVHRNQFLVCRGTVRAILASYLRVRPLDVSIAAAQAGKPYLDHGAGMPFFNVSHSGDVAALTVSRTFEVGVDIELKRAVEPAVARNYFARSEIEVLDSLPADDWQDAFYRCWTRKEAVVKTLGDGLLIPLDSFHVPLDDAPGPLPISAEAPTARWQDLRLFPFRAGVDAVGAVCVACGQSPVVLNMRRWAVQPGA